MELTDQPTQSRMQPHGPRQSRREAAALLKASKRQALLAEMEESFQGHVLTDKEVTPNSLAGYYCLRNPKSSHYWFQLAFAPGVITISGDCSEIMIVGKSVKWLVDTAGYPADIIRHISRKMPTERFDKESAAAWLDEKRAAILNQYEADAAGDIDEDELSREDQSTIEEIEEAQELLDSLGRSKIEHGIFLQSAPLTYEEREEDGLDFLEPDTDILWKVAAIRCFARLVPVDQRMTDQLGKKEK
jgi:hypothetical protein